MQENYLTVTNEGTLCRFKEVDRLYMDPIEIQEEIKKRIMAEKSVSVYALNKLLRSKMCPNEQKQKLIKQ